MRYERPESAERSRARSLFWNVVALLFGWTLFLYWWWVVLGRTTRHVFWHLVSGLVLLMASLVVLSLAWIVHNLRLAGKGRRNRATPYHPGAFDRDKLNRPLVLEDIHLLREAPVVVIQSTSEQKLYREGEARDSA